MRTRMMQGVKPSLLALLNSQDEVQFVPRLIEMGCHGLLRFLRVG